MATSRPSRPSLARYTTPIPPSPMGARISYGPRVSPVDSGMVLLYSIYYEQIAQCPLYRISHGLAIGSDPQVDMAADPGQVRRRPFFPKLAVSRGHIHLENVNRQLVGRAN